MKGDALLTTNIKLDDATVRSIIADHLTRLYNVLVKPADITPVSGKSLDVFVKATITSKSSSSQYRD